MSLIQPEPRRSRHFRREKHIVHRGQPCKIRRWIGAMLVAAKILAVSVKAANGDIQYGTVLHGGGQMQFSASGLSTNGTFAFGLTSTANLTNILESAFAKLLITVNSPGYNDDGSTNATSRTIFGTSSYRYTYPSQAYPYVLVTNSAAVFWVNLSEPICSEDVVTSVTTLSGLYTQGGTPTAAYSSGTATNLSTLSVARARPLAMWADVPYQLVGGSYTCRVVAFQYFGRQGRSVRAVEFWGVGANSAAASAHVFVTSPTIDLTQNDPTPVEEWVGVVSNSAFTQGETIKYYFKIYPWIGVALDASDGVNTERDADYGPLYMKCNKSGTYNVGAFAAVDPTNGNDGTGTTYSTQAAAEAGNPYATIGAAMTAAGAFNNSTYGTNSYQACTILLTNGTHNWWGATVTSRSASETWCIVTHRSDVARGSPALLTRSTSQTGNKTMKLKLDGIGIANTANSTLLDNGYGETWLNNVWIGTNTGSSAKISDFHTNIWVWHSTNFAWRVGLVNTISQAKSFVKIRGMTMYRGGGTTNTTTFSPALLIGCLIQPPASEPQQIQFANDNDILIPNDPCIWAFNRYYGADSLVYPFKLGIGTNILKGAAVVQNVIEASKSGAGIPFDVMYSDKENEVCTNFLSWHNTIIAVYHAPFVLSAYTNVTAAFYEDKNNLYGDWEVGADTKNSFTMPGPPYARWDQFYSVGSSGNASAEIANGVVIPGGATTLWFSGLNFFEQTIGNISRFYFVSNLSAYDSGGGAGSGNYRLQSRSPLVVANNERILAYDIEGIPRGGFDPPGAYASASPRKGGMFFAQ